MSVAATESNLHSLRDRPFELMAALEARLIASGEERGLEAAGAEWTGLAFGVGDESLLAPQADVREVLEPPSFTRVPGAKAWLLGVANVRGDLLPIVDLGRLLGRDETVLDNNSRVVVLNDDDVPVGFLVDRVAGFRGFAPEDQRHELVDEAEESAISPFLLGAFVREGTVWKVFSLRKLAADPAFRDAGA